MKILIKPEKILVQVFGHLPHDCDEGLLLALTGFFTDMALSWFLDRPVIYTPLKICSIYAGVIGAVATAAGISNYQ